MASQNFYRECDFKYSEIAVLLNDVHRISDRIGNFFIPILTPVMNSTNEIYNERPAPSTNNIVNSDASTGVSSYIESNYTELKIPFYLFPIPNECDRRNVPSGGCDCGNTHMSVEHTHQCAFINKDTILTKGTRFYITFVGGDLSNIKIIGVINEYGND